MAPIIGYIHICQIGEWERSFRMILDAMKKSKLYDAVKEIRLGILCPNCSEYENVGLLNDPKFRVVYVGNPGEYERPTLLHMKQAAETDPLDAKYFYLHTKGLRWFGTPYEPFVVDWIKLLIYWNIEKWINADDIVGKYDTYGCNYHSGDKYPLHYSGNFFWTTSHHLKVLPDVIGPGYNAPEFWLCSAGMFAGKPNAYNSFSSEFEDTMGHYNNLFPESKYRDDL
jgi:hypothetical protein